MIHHTQDALCPNCEGKLMTAHEKLGEWFRAIKKRYPNVHISWAWRGPADQEAAFRDGKSNAHFGQSPHNNEKDGKPYRLALDLFQIDEDGVARFSGVFCAKVNEENEANREPIQWGGKFKHLGDADHFQIQ